MSKVRTLFYALLLACLLTVSSVMASPRSESEFLDCDALANSYFTVPEGYAEHCLGEIAIKPAPDISSTVPGEIAYVFEFYSRREIATHQLNNFPVQSQIAPVPTNTYFGLDFNAAADTLYANAWNTGMLGTIDLTTGAFSAIGPSVPLASHTVTGLTIDPVTNQAYASSTSFSESALYSVNLSTGALTLIGTDSTAPFIIDISINSDGDMYGHDISTDSIYTIDVATGAQNLVGSTGVNSNYAQGMDFDNNDGTLYAWTFQDDFTNRYGTINLATGALTPLSIDNPVGQYYGATRTRYLDPGNLTFYDDRDVFNDANPDLPVEDFEGTLVPPNSVLNCQGSFNSNTDNGCFAPGGILPGIDLEASSGDMVVLTEGFLDVPSAVVGPNFFGDDFDISFSETVYVVGMDWLSPIVFGPIDILFDVYGPGDVLLGSTKLTSAALPPFF